MGAQPGRSCSIKQCELGLGGHPQADIKAVRKVLLTTKFILEFSYLPFFYSLFSLFRKKSNLVNLRKELLGFQHKVVLRGAHKLRLDKIGITPQQRGVTDGVAHLKQKGCTPSSTGGQIVSGLALLRFLTFY